MPLRGAVVQSLNVRQIFLRASVPAAKCVGGEFGIGEDHAAEADGVDPAGADRGLGHVRHVILQVRIAGADHRHFRHGLFALAGGVDLPRDADQRIFRRLIAVAGGKNGRPLNVRIVIRAAARQIHRRHAGAVQAADQFDRLAQIDFQRIVRVDAEAELVRQQMPVLKRFTDFDGWFCTAACRTR